MPTTSEYIKSIIANLRTIKAFSYVDEAECRETLKKMDDDLDKLRNHLEGRKVDRDAGIL